MIAERVPGEIGQHPVVLVPIVAVVREDEVRRRPALQRFECRLDFGAVVRERSRREMRGA